MATAQLHDKADGVYLPFTVPASNANRPFAVAGDLLIGGWSFIETTGTQPAAIQLVDGDPNGGTVVAELALTPGQSIRDILPGSGVEVRSGLWIIATSGNVRGSIWVCDL